MVHSNPAHPESASILNTIRSFSVKYIDDQGVEQKGFIEMHDSVVEDVEAFFEEAYTLHFPIHKVAVSSDFEWDDTVLMAQNITSGFNYRTIKGTSRPSLHGSGLAFDVNPLLNPYIRFTGTAAVTDPPGALYNPSIPGTLTANHPLVTLMKGRGWEWGGDWTPESGRTDYQHFQKTLEL